MPGMANLIFFLNSVTLIAAMENKYFLSMQVTLSLAGQNQGLWVQCNLDPLYITICTRMLQYILIDLQNCIPKCSIICS